MRAHFVLESIGMDQWNNEEVKWYSIFKIIVCYFHRLSVLGEWLGSRGTSFISNQSNPIHLQLNRDNTRNASYAASGEREWHLRESRTERYQHITILAENQYVSEHKAICNFYYWGHWIEWEVSCFWCSSQRVKFFFLLLQCSSVAVCWAQPVKLKRRIWLAAWF